MLLANNFASLRGTSMYKLVHLHNTISCDLIMSKQNKH